MSSGGGESSGGFEDKRENISPEARARKQPWSGAHRDGAMELFRVMRESSAQIVKRRAADFSGQGAKNNMATSPPSRAFGRTVIRSSHQPLCQGGDMGRLADSHKTGGLYGRPCRLLFLLAAFYSPPRCQRSLSTDGSAQTDRVCFT